jgi:hypothetical protein
MFKLRTRGVSSCWRRMRSGRSCLRESRTAGLQPRSKSWRSLLLSSLPQRHESKRRGYTLPIGFFGALVCVHIRGPSARRLETTGQGPPLVAYHTPCVQMRRLSLPHPYVQLKVSLVQAEPSMGIPCGHAGSGFGVAQCHVGSPLHTLTGPPVLQFVHWQVRSPYVQ